MPKRIHWHNRRWRIQKIRNGGGRNGGRLRQNHVLAVCTERSTGNIPAPSLIVMAVNGGRAPGAPPPPKSAPGHQTSAPQVQTASRTDSKHFRHFCFLACLPPFPEIYRISWKGGVKTFTSTHTPLGHCPRDVIRPPVNWKTPPLLDIHEHHHPLDIARVTSSTFQGGGGGWSVPVTHTLHRFSVSGQIQLKYLRNQPKAYCSILWRVIVRSC